MADEHSGPEKVQVDRRQVRAEIGQAPGLPADTYGMQTHLDNAERIYGVPHYVVAGALSWLEQTSPDDYDPAQLSITQVKNALNKYQAQQVKE